MHRVSHRPCTVKQDFDLFYEARQDWSSYILINANDRILEYRRYYPSLVTALECKAEYRVRGLEKMHQYIKKQASKHQNNRWGDLLTSVNKLTSNDWSGVTAHTKVKENAGNFEGYVEPTLFSGLHYLLLYRNGVQTPQEVFRIEPSGEGFAPWKTLTEADRDREETRRRILLKGSYLLDNAILPEGRPVGPGDQWRVKANVFGDVMGLRTAQRLDKVSGSLGFRRTLDDPQRGDRRLAMIKLEGSETDNRILLSSLPQTVVKPVRNLEETYAVTFSPEGGRAFFDPLNEQLVELELNGTAGIDRKRKSGLSSVLGLDSTLTIAPTFTMEFKNRLLEKHLLNQNADRKVI
ncbi:MAG: hypothetical protein AAF492_31995, partial [Verrucomicrobiota bacterium]